MPWLLNEDAALRELLKGLTVADERNPTRAVGVYYGLPDPEVREKKYPFLTIDLVGIGEDIERTMRGRILLPYVPEGVTAPSAGELLPADYPTPYRLDYQITSWCRFPQHDRQLLSSLLHGPLQHHFAQVPVDGDRTARRLDLTQVAKSDTLDSNGKRIFRNVFTVRMSAELFRTQVVAVQKALSVNFQPATDPDFSSI